MIKLDREYQSTGVISAGSGIYVYNSTLDKFVLLVPTSDMPAGAGAPDTIDNPILTVSRNGQVEGKQTVQQKKYTINWNRDNIRRLRNFEGQQLEFIERDGMENTGWKFIGTISFDKDAFADNEIMNGNVFITVNEDLGYVDDVRGEIAPTAVITSALPSIKIAGTSTVDIGIKSSSNDDTITATSENTSACTVSYSAQTKKLTVTGVAKGYAIVSLTCSHTGEGSSERTFQVEVTEA